MKDKKMRIAAVALDSVSGDVEQNLWQIENACKQASQKGMDVIFFPELAVIGNNTEELGMKLFELAEYIPGRVSEKMADIAKCTGMYLIVGLLQKSRVPGRLFTTLVIINPIGEIKVRYQKNYLEGKEQLFLKGSVKKEIRTYDFPSAKGGFLMGADIENEELLEALKNENIKIIFATGLKTEEKRKYLCKVAEKNKCYIVRVDREAADVIAPSGKMVASAKGKEVLYYTVVFE